MLNSDIKTKWVEALRSGNYNQDIGKLKITNAENKSSYCCLGVLKEVAGMPIPMSNNVLFDNSVNVSNHNVLYNKEREKLGISEEEMRNLIDLNDSGYYTFEQIASYIEENM